MKEEGHFDGDQGRAIQNHRHKKRLLAGGRPILLADPRHAIVLPEVWNSLSQSSVSLAAATSTCAGLGLAWYLASLVSRPSEPMRCRNVVLTNDHCDAAYQSKYKCNRHGPVVVADTFHERQACVEAKEDGDGHHQEHHRRHGNGDHLLLRGCAGGCPSKPLSSSGGWMLDG